MRADPAVTLKECDFQWEKSSFWAAPMTIESLALSHPVRVMVTHFEPSLVAVTDPVDGGDARFDPDDFRELLFVVSLELNGCFHASPQN